MKTTQFFLTFFIGFLLLFPLHQARPAREDLVSIPDANLRAALEQALGKASGDDITEGDMNDFTGNQGPALWVSSSVNDLTGLQYATGVTGMRFFHQEQTIHNGRGFLVTENDIRDLSPLRNLTKLEYLSILHKDITDISPLENLTELTVLTLRRQNTSPSSSALALTTLAGLTKLTKLSLSDNVEDISPLYGLTALTNLTLSNNRIVDISPLRDLTALKRLDLGYNEITDISPLRSLTNLDTLTLRDNVALSDISHLKYLTKLKNLWLHRTSITTSGLGEVLPSLGSLKHLILQITRISDLSVLDRFPADVSLASLDLRYIGTGRDLAWLLTDITPLVAFVQAGKMGHDSRFSGSPLINLNWNFGLDYESIYTDLPDLINGLSHGTVEYQSSEPALEAEDQAGHPGTRHTFVVRAVNNTTVGPWTWNNRGFEGVPVTFTVSAPDSTTETHEPVLTGGDGLAGVSITLGDDGQEHTVTAVVPENRPIPGEIEHPELRVTFTVRADITVPPRRRPDVPPRLTVTFADYPEEKPIDEFPLTLRFSEPVIGFEKEDITVETELKTGTGTATLVDLTPETPVHPDRVAPGPVQTYTATVELPPRARGTVKLIVRADAATTPATAPVEKIGPSSEAASDPIEFGRRRVVIYPSHVAMDTIIFNEFRNAEDDKNDWIELKNISEEEVSLKDYEVSLVVPHAISPVTPQWEIFAMDRDVVAFPDYTLPPGGVLLIVNTDPSENDLIRGQDIANPKHTPDLLPWYLLAPDMKLPQHPYLLILRSQTDKNGKPEAFEDLLGNYHKDDVNYRTQIWPLRDTWVYTGTEAELTEGEVYQRVMVPRVSSRTLVSTLQPEKRGYLRGAWVLSEAESGLGYRPGAPVETSLGTPGYPNAVIVNETGTGQISISEVMFATPNDQSAAPAQWIELYNNSETEIVDLQGWELVITASNAPIPFRSTALVLNALEVLPNQTVLLVTQVGRHSENIPDRRIYDLRTQHAGARYLRLRANWVLSSEGFVLYLFAPDGTLVDRAGNLTGRRGSEKPRWQLPDGWTEDGARTSLIRRYEDRVPAPGTEASGWVRAADTALLTGYSYWGLPTDDGTPGYRQGSPLPVTLSQFRADRTETGVVVQWTTQSEMDNAGFHLLRSRDSQAGFVRVNPSLILGAGTTAERHTYTYTDTTAQSNVPYYYRLEDVSLSGERRTAATVRLRGYLSATGKVLWKWADVKSELK